MTIEQPNYAPASIDEMNAILGTQEQDTYVDEPDTIRHPHTGRILKHKNDGADDQLIVQFTTEATFNKLLTYRAGGVPKYVDQEFITITCPGDNSLTVHSPVTEFYKWRFPVDYANFKKGQGEILSGTPLALWPLLTQSQIKELTFMNIRTVEQIANLSDSASGKFAGFHALKRQAQQFLELAQDKAAQGRLQAELDQRDSQHKAQMAAMQEQMDRLAKLLEEQAAKAAEPKAKVK